MIVYIYSVKVFYRELFIDCRDCAIESRCSAIYRDREWIYSIICLWRCRAHLLHWRQNDAVRIFAVWQRQQSDHYQAEFIK